MNSFNKPIFLKEDSSLEKKLEVLKNNYYSSKSDIYMIEEGIFGEKQVEYHLEKSNLGMYILRDINLQVDGMTAQIDFVVITSHHCYFIECKNYNADIIHIDENRNFELSTRYKNRYNRIGIKSPLSQVEDQLSVFQRICLKDKETIKSLLNGIKFKDYLKTMVVFTNPSSRINNKKAPYDMKYKVLKVDNLISQIKYDDSHYTGKRLTQDEMKDFAKYFINNHVEPTIDITSTYSQEVLNNEYNQFLQANRINTYQNSRINKPKKNNIINKIILPIVYVVILLLFAYGVLTSFINKYTNNSPNIFGSREKIISEDQVNAINNLKEVYLSSKENGFDLYNYDQCIKIKELLSDSFNCSGYPIKVNFIEDNTITVKDTSKCYSFKFDEETRKVINISSDYVWINDKCSGVDVGLIHYNENNPYYEKIGGYNKILEMARYAHNYSSGFDKYYDYTHIAERGGNPSLASTYKMKVDGYFGGLTNKGTFHYFGLDEFNTMCEYYYYIMK